MTQIGFLDPFYRAWKSFNIFQYFSVGACRCIVYVSGLLRPRSPRIPHHIICTSSATDSWRRDRRASWATRTKKEKRPQANESYESKLVGGCKMNLVNSGKCITIDPYSHIMSYSSNPAIQKRHIRNTVAPPNASEERNANTPLVCSCNTSHRYNECQRQ